MYAIYGNIYHQYTPFMLAYIPYMDPMGYNTHFYVNIYHYILYIYMCVCVGREIERERERERETSDLRHRVCGIIHTDLKPENVLPEFSWCCNMVIQWD